MTNKELADVFLLIANLLEIKGEVIYKTLAYRKASENLANLGRDVNDIWKEGGERAAGDSRGGQSHRRKDRRAAQYRQA